MAGSQWFSVFDMASGYWQVPMAAKDKHLTAFATKDGLFEWNVMPFGLRNAPATYCKLMGTVLAGMTYRDCMVYMDDVMVFSKDIDSHLQAQTRVFERLREHNLMVSPAKTFLFHEEAT